MAEKKIQENPLPEESTEPEKPKDMPAKTEKTVVVPAAPVQISVPAFTKYQPNDLYRRLLPAVLFVLTFVTVMTILLICMDNAARQAQEFRLNMTKDYEMVRINQRSDSLVEFLKQVHVVSPKYPKGPVNVVGAMAPTARTRALERLIGDVYNGTFVEFFPRGPRSSSTLYLERARGWRGLVVRANTRDFLDLTAPQALHACLASTPHPLVTMYPEEGFSSRVLCLPLLPALLAASAENAQYMQLAGTNVAAALHALPFEEVHLQVIEVFPPDSTSRENVTSLLITKNYTVVATFEDSVMYKLHD